jgi:glycosyltransferase involved in cell wall biosynthesis
MPIGALEALACGVPQVVTRVSGTPEAVAPETGILVEPKDVDGLAGALVELAIDPRRRASMSAASIARHGTLFARDRMVDQTAALYEEAAARRSPRHRARPRPVPAS